jgi:hypothetical protein
MTVNRSPRPERPTTAPYASSLPDASFMPRPYVAATNDAGMPYADGAA